MIRALLLCLAIGAIVVGVAIATSPLSTIATTLATTR
jgi:hypothetical protein